LKIETKKNQICNTVISASKYIDHNVLMIKLTQPVYFQADLMIDNQYWGIKIILKILAFRQIHLLITWT